MNIRFEYQISEFAIYSHGPGKAGGVQRCSRVTDSKLRFAASLIFYIVEVLKFRELLQLIQHDGVLLRPLDHSDNNNDDDNNDHREQLTCSSPFGPF